MKAKILELIHKELETMGDKNIFLRRDTFGVYNPINPVKTENSIVYVEYFTDSWSINTREYEQNEIVEFVLTFPDGEPPIEIKSTIDSVSESKVKKKKYLGIFSVKTNITEFEYTNFITTKITCGKFVFELTDVERDELLEKVKFAYQRYKLEQDKVYEEEITNKLDLRLSKWKK